MRCLLLHQADTATGQDLVTARRQTFAQIKDIVRIPELDYKPSARYNGGILPQFFLLV